ncbi:MAG TPA: tetratricopeptide repeat protein [Pirellulales bacterium]|nr:tetratricopeptide repeat protein [Pirellulales bacterium]
MRIALAVAIALFFAVGGPAPGFAEPSKSPVEPPTRPAAAGPAALDLDDPAEPFVPARARAEDDENRIEALGLFAAGRINEQEDRPLEALRRYERASRFDPSSQVARRQAVLTAIRLERWSDALRYAARGDLDVDEASVLWELGRHFEEQEQYEAALRHFRAARALQTDKHSAGYVLLTREIGRSALLARQSPEAADAFAELVKALEHPEQHGVDERTRRRISLDGEGASGMAALYLLSAEAFLSADRPDQATAALEKAEAAAPNAAVHAYRVARVEDARHQPAKALDLLNKYFETKETGAGLAPYQLLAKVLTDLGRETELAATLEKLHERDTDNPLLSLFLAEQYQKASQFEKAAPLYRDMLANSPTPLAYEGLAVSQHRLKQTAALFDLLADVAGKAGDLDPLGDETAAIAADAETVGALLQLAKEKHQADADSLGYGARLAMALVALKAGRMDDAAEFFERAIKVNRESAKHVYRVWGTGLLADKHYGAAARIFRRAIDERAVAGDDPTFHYFLSAALVLDDKADEALEAAKHAASLNPRSIMLAGRVAWVAYYAKHYDEARAAYEDFLRRFDEPGKAEGERKELHQARMILSSIAVIEHDLPAAEEWLSQVLDEFPDDIGAQNDLGYLWADQGKRLKTSLAMIERAVAAEPENVAYRDSLGWVLHRLGRHEEAVVELKKAASGESPDGVMLEHLGEACQAAGQHDAAKDAWQKALTAFEKAADPEKIARVKQKLAGAG